MSTSSRSNAGRSILQILWEELDQQMAKLMALKLDGWGDNDRSVSAQRGRCLGIAWCIAIMTNPYDPEVDVVRKEAMERYEANNVSG